MGHALGEMGCIWLGDAQADVITRAPAEIAAFFGWLRGHGEPDVTRVAAQEIKAVITEVKEVPAFGQSGSAVGFFRPDREPVTDRDIATAVRRLGYARLDLLESVSALPPEALDWSPPGGKRTIRKNLEHVANAQGFYLVRILGRPGVEAILPEPWPQETFARLRWVMERAVETIYGLGREQRTGVFRASEPDEDWTARKMLRRFVEHEREHVDVVRRTIEAWRAATCAALS